MSRTAQVSSRPLPSLATTRYDLWYVAAVCVGAVLMVLAALYQPYNQNELQQMAPYGSRDLVAIVTGTRQPPLDPLLGALLQELFGQGHLRQRLVPVLAGVGTLVVMALLLRRLTIGAAGVFGTWMLATTPILVRFAAYTRPYALPLFLMVLFAWAVCCWTQDGRRRWLVLAGVCAVAMPLSRVPEPSVFLATTTAVLGWAGLRGQLTWRQAGPPAAISAAGLVGVAVPMTLVLESQTEALSTSTSTPLTERLSTGTEGIVDWVLPLLATWFPWWPVTLLVLVAALAVPQARRALFGWWVWWPLLAAPVAFLLLYHYVQLFDLEYLPYRARFLYFFAPAYVLIGTAVGVAATRTGPVRLRSGLWVLLGASLASQLPAAVHVATSKDGADFDQAAQVLREELPADALVLHENPNPPGRPTMGYYSGDPRFGGDLPETLSAKTLTRPGNLPDTIGPVYFLVLDSECGTVACDNEPQSWDRSPDGWEVMVRFDRYTLYGAQDGRTGTEGVATALQDFADAFGPGLGYVETYAAANVLRELGRPGDGRELIEDMYAEADPQTVDLLRTTPQVAELDPFAR